MIVNAYSQFPQKSIAFHGRRHCKIITSAMSNVTLIAMSH